ncbi:unnamed protein product [Caenorhabditis sp. 36 PRJEB53466]|nr:unnamed protein product [Caenorhabditis sp. 36 PRJEB53466]
MLQDIREYTRLGVGLLLTMKANAERVPRICARHIHRFLVWFTDDFDYGYILFDAWVLWFVYLLCGIIQTYTDLFGYFFLLLWLLIDACVYLILFSWWFCLTYWVPFAVIFVVGMGNAHIKFKKRREIQDMMWSYVDEEEDMPVNVCDIRPQPSNCRGWGTKDEDIEPVDNFVAPTKCIKISGMVGMIPGMQMQDNICRMNQALKDKLAPGAVNGPYPWLKVTVDTRVALVYVKFKTIEDATHCFNILDGLSFDGKSFAFSPHSLFLKNVPPEVRDTCYPQVFRRIPSLLQPDNLNHHFSDPQCFTGRRDP